MKENIKGKIFDIRRFSTHDGEGIRTTIFFKGCNLKCVWCQNPEGIPMNDNVLYFENRCIKCDTCKQIDSENLIYNENNKIKFRNSNRENILKYINQCPVNALAMDCEEYTVQELMDEVKKDIVFFYHNGGITISGGEPLLQSDFVIEFLKECKKEGIHTAIETAANVREEVIDEVIQYLDLVYVDFKIIDDIHHKNHTGVSNKRIKKNIEKLLNSHIKDSVIVRTPMIPNFISTKDNVFNISKFISDIYSDVKYEILNYNPLAMSKYNLVDENYCFERNPKMYSKKQMDEFYKIAYMGGVKNLIKE